MFVILNPKKQTEHRFYGRCQRGLGNISAGFFLPLVFENSHYNLLYIELWLLDWTPVHFYQRNFSNERERYLLVLAEMIAELIVLDFINFIKLNVNYGNMKWVDTFFFFAQ